MTRVIVGSLALLIVSACGGAPLAEVDPDGFAACQHIARSETSAEGLLEVVAAGEVARSASTKAIRDAAGDGMGEEFLEAMRGTQAEGTDFFFPDVDAMKEACQDNGFEF